MVNTVALFCLLVVVTVAQAGYRRRLKSKRLWNSFPNGRIVGGVDTDITQIPYLVQLVKDDRQTCGASIISATYVLTAAHCTDGFQASQIIIRYGTSQFSVGGTMEQVAKIAQHPNYDALDFDVSVLCPQNKIIFSDRAMPIGLASVEPTAGEEGLISGWGQISLHGEASFELKSVIVPVISREECNIHSKYDVTENMICAGVLGKGGCYGDSGGPFVINNVQSGISSWTGDCAETDCHTGFANVAALRDFIDANSNYTARWV